MFCRTRGSDRSNYYSYYYYLNCCFISILQKKLVFLSPYACSIPGSVLLLSIFSTTLLREMLCCCVFLHTDNKDVRRCWLRVWVSGSVLALSFVCSFTLTGTSDGTPRDEVKPRGNGEESEMERGENSFLWHTYSQFQSHTSPSYLRSRSLSLSRSPCPLSCSPLSPLFALLATNLDEVYSRYGQTQAGPALFYCASLDWCSHIYCSHTLRRSRIETHY